jgi:nucleotide-binding universal stress UspA family protein
MIDFQHILVPFDGSSSSRVALNMAMSLSKRFQSKITAVYVKRTDDDKKASQVSDELKSLSAEHEVEMTFLQPTGKMFKEVVRTVEQVEAGLVIMGTHGVSGFEEFWIGSNAFRVVSSSPVPVITMQEDFDRRGFKKILAPIDQSKETRQKVPHLAQIAKVFGADIHLLGATKYTDADSHATVKRYLEQSKELLEKQELKVESSYILGQNIAKSTLEAAEEFDVDLTIMMSESEPSSGLFMGSNAQQVVNRSGTPVLTLHPKDISVVAAAGY